MRNNHSKKSEDKMYTFLPDPLIHARRALDAVASRLRRIEDLSHRMNIEGVSLSVQEYVARLRKRKKTLSEQIKKGALQKKSYARLHYPRYATPPFPTNSPD